MFFFHLKEAFVVCEGYQPPVDYIPNMLNPLLDQKYTSYDELEGSNRIIVPFIACGDLNTQFDSDKTYPLIIGNFFLNISIRNL